MSKLYKIGGDGQLLSTETTKVIFVDGQNVRIGKSVDEMQGYKPLRPATGITEPSVYTYNVTTYVDMGDYIQTVITLTDKTAEQIQEINSEWWADNYFFIPSVEMWAAKKSYKDGVEYDLFKDTVPELIMAAGQDQLTHLELMSQPDFTQKLTSEYVNSIKVSITDPTLMGAAIGYLASLSYVGREIPFLQ